MTLDKIHDNIKKSIEDNKPVDFKKLLLEYIKHSHKLLAKSYNIQVKNAKP